VLNFIAYAVCFDNFCVVCFPGKNIYTNEYIAIKLVSSGVFLISEHVQFIWIAGVMNLCCYSAVNCIVACDENFVNLFNASGFLAVFLVWSLVLV